MCAFNCNARDTHPRLPRPLEFYIDRYADTREERAKEGSVGIQICYFHVLQAWERWLRRGDSGIGSLKGDAMSLMRTMCNATDINTFDRYHTLFLRFCKNNQLHKLQTYFTATWYPCRKLWSFAWMARFSTGWKLVRTNNLVERFFRTLKSKFLNQKHNRRMDVLLRTLVEDVSKFYEMRSSISRKHRSPEDQKFDMAKSRLGKAQYLYLNHGYEILPNVPYTAKFKSESRDAIYTASLSSGGTCSCDDMSSLLCKHIHCLGLIFEAEGGLEPHGLRVDSERNTGVDITADGEIIVLDAVPYERVDFLRSEQLWRIHMDGEADPHNDSNDHDRPIDNADCIDIRDESDNAIDTTVARKRTRMNGHNDAPNCADQNAIHDCDNDDGLEVSILSPINGNLGMLEKAEKGLRLLKAAYAILKTIPTTGATKKVHDEAKFEQQAYNDRNKQLLTRHSFTGHTKSRNLKSRAIELDDSEDDLLDADESTRLIPILSRGRPRLGTKPGTLSIRPPKEDIEAVKRLELLTEVICIDLDMEPGIDKENTLPQESQSVPSKKKRSRATKKAAKVTLAPPTTTKVKKSLEENVGEKGLDENVSVRALDDNVGYTKPAEHIRQGLPTEVRPFLTSTVEVKADGNCGFRAVAVSLGRSQDDWPNIRKELRLEMEKNEETYVKIFGAKAYRGYLDRVKWDSGGCSFSHWLAMPDFGYIIANAYEVGVYFFSREANWTILPCVHPSSAMPSPPTKVVAMYLAYQHYTPIFLAEGSPSPPLVPDCKQV